MRSIRSVTQRRAVFVAQFVPGGVLLSMDVQPLLKGDDRIESRWDFVLNVGRRNSGASVQFWAVFQGLLDAEGLAV